MGDSSVSRADAEAGGSAGWRPLEDRVPGVGVSSTPAEAVVGRWGELNVFACPSDPRQPHRWSIQ
ncbi:hypothetical protein Slala05_25460 [Streptomyces lavendulae subsp. lavendulae]|nr:hypothetical protein Slala05_25460 [Streptomyces lavendulae subsp. lavendulae]